MCVYSQVLAGSIGSVYTKVCHALENSKYINIYNKNIGTVYVM